MRRVSPSVFLGHFQSQLPEHTDTQENSLAWLALIHARAEKTLQEKYPPETKDTRMMSPDFLKKLFDKFGCGPQKIARRYSDIGDFLCSDPEAMAIYNVDKFPQGVPMGKRQDIFEKVSTDRMKGFYADSAQKAPPGDLLHVSCTGYASPSAAQKIVLEKGWGESTRVTHLYHMGCYAAFPALRSASALALEHMISGAPRRVDIVHNELCTLHLNPSLHTPEQMVVQSLFADGHIRWSVWSSEESPTEKCFHLLSQHEALIPNTSQHMTWKPTEWGMEMRLLREVPEAIEEHIQPFFEALFAKAGLDFERDAAAALFAIHPGGPRIVEKLAAKLNLTGQQVSHAVATLWNRGNMSSATVPHIWETLIQDPDVQAGQLVASVAFGPGLTATGSLMRVVS